MTDLPPVIESPSFIDRSNGLKGFGILHIVLGAICALMSGLMLLGSLFMTASQDKQVSPAMLLMPVVIYTGLAIGLIWLGVGSMQARRWARTLIMLFSWSGLYMGVLVVILFLTFDFTPDVPPDGRAGAVVFQSVFKVFMIVFVGIFFVALPGILAWFYSKKDVQLTCEARNPVPSWTDRCPPTVLFMTLWQTFSAVTVLILPLGYHGTVPQFGVILTGLTGYAFCLVQFGLLLTSSVLFFRLSSKGWWLMLMLLAAMLASGLMNVLTLDYQALYQAMGFSGDQLKQALRVHFTQGTFGLFFILFCMAPGFALLAWTRRYFTPLHPEQNERL